MPSRNRGDFCDVHRPLCIGNAVLSKEKALPPLQAVLANAQGGGHAADLALDVGKGIEDLAVSSMLTTGRRQKSVGRLTRQVARSRDYRPQRHASCIQRTALVITAAVVCVIVQSGATESQAEVAPRDIQLCQQIHPL
ncbi:hypothetical protein D3C71_1046480 [compost metagenome]